MKPPLDPQRHLMRQIVEHSGDLAPILQAQFSSCRTAREEHCPECFRLGVTGAVPLLPTETDCPLSFDAEIRGMNGVGDHVQVLLWHEDGRINSIEISGVLDPHPAVGDLHSVASRRGVG